MDEAAPLSLSTAQVDLWLCQPEAVPAPLLERYRALLDAEESARLERAGGAAQARAQLAARALLRTTLARYLACDPASLSFRRTPHGRPQLEEPAGLEFNLTHTEGLIALVVTGAAAAGVDAERLRARDYGAVARRWFSPAEYEALQALEPEERRLRFFDYWVLKEAYAKACGRGIAMGLASFSVSLAPPAATLQAPDAGAWWLALLQPGAQHRLGLAVRGLAGRPALRARWAVPLGEERPATPAVLAATTSPEMLS